MAAVVIMGANGMLGHRVVRRLASSRSVIAVTRRPVPLQQIAGGHRKGVELNVMPEFTPAVLDGLLARHRPAAVINAAGLVKQRPEAADRAAMIRANALLPHELAQGCARAGCRLIQISTDCVFSGRRGGYAEDDVPDAVDLYGRSKLLGEVTEHGCLTLRTSLIGPELDTQQGLLEWFRARRGEVVQGYRRAIFSGLPTIHAARVLENLLDFHPELSGLYHVASHPISKFELLGLINARFGLEVTIHPVDTPAYDRSLDGTRFTRATGFRAEPWETMVDEMARDEEHAWV